MHWLDGISLDDNLISGRASGSNGENSDSNNHSKATTKAKRRRHAHYKLNGRLDRKSSRGMIYENEELRLRTININAEVERGQSDIKRLRRENEHLRREIWTLRDECDRLNKRFKARLVEATHDHHGGCNVRGSGTSGGCSGRRGSCDGPHSNSNSEESDSCDTCRGDNDDIYMDDFKYAPPNDCCLDGSCQAPPTKSQQQLLVERMAAKFNHTQTNAATKETASDEDQQLHTSFDHLSVVSEETLSNSEVVSTTILSGNLLGYNQDVNGSQSTLPSLVRPLTPLTPVELVANELHDLQSAVPPLSYFENIVQQHIGPSSASQSADSTRTTNSGKTVIQTNGWDYNLQSPFTQRKYPSNSSSSSSTSRSPAQTLTTFVPPTSAFSPHYTAEQALTSRTNVPNIETVAITTVSPSSAATINSPKHFFAPLKPRLKINTALANRNLPATIVPPLPPVVPPNYNPPDIFVNNALASPYHRPGVATPTSTSVPTTSTNAMSTTNAAGHELPQRQSPQVSSRQRRRRHNHQQHHQHQHHHNSEHQRQRHHQHVATVDIFVADDDAGANNVSAAAATAAVAADLKEITVQTATHQVHEPQNPQKLENFNQINTTKLNEPIYATAQKSCNNLITAPAVTQPLMTTTIVTTTLPSTTTFSTNSSYVSSTRTITTTTTTATETSTITTMTTMGGQTQTDSANLEAILNDIETISEDILAIQLEKNKSRENLPDIQAQRKLHQNDKNKKPYRSEMNLLLTYDGSNPTITPTTSASTTNTNAIQDGTLRTSVDNSSRRARSLEREHTESPSPNVPDPMAPFPNNRTYIGFDQVNAAVGSSKPPLPPSQVTTQLNTVGVGNKPAIPIKPSPPTPPTRKHPTPLSLNQTPMTPSPTTNNEDQLGQRKLAAPPNVASLTPNKSHLFAALANAAVAKRAQFRATPLHLTRSLDTDRLVLTTPEQDSQVAEIARRKGRRVSIVCSNNSKEAGTAQATAASPTPTSAAHGSCIDLQAPNPVIMHLRQTSHSTPNSPHSMRRGSYSIIETPNVGSPHHHNHPPPPGPYTPTHQSLQPRASIPGQHRKANQDSPRAALTSAAPDLAAAAAAAVASRSKCSRRHSDSTVASGKLRTSGASIRQHHHHNHNHQQQLHPTPLVSTNPHHSHQDSNLDTGTSISDRNSNSLASSRESSTSFSMRSQRRKISVSSHTGGKIPWCGCWGNGCL